MSLYDAQHGPAETAATITESDMYRKMAGSATPVEMIGPPLLLLAVIVIALLVFSMTSQPLWWRHAICRARKKTLRHMRPGVGSADSFDYIRQGSLGGGRATPDTATSSNPAIPPKRSFWTRQDLGIMFDFRRFQNKPYDLLFLSLPTVLSLAFCPVTLVLHRPMVEFFWPYAEFAQAPNINDAISCFLVPAGLVYAIAFGFAYQEAVARQNAIVAMLADRHGLMEQVVMLTSACKGFVAEQRLQILLFLKDDTLAVLRVFMNRCKQKESPFAERLARFHEILMMVGESRGKDSPPDDAFEQDVQNKLYDTILQLNKETSKTRGYVGSSMKLLEWAFLESLGFFAFFGILLLEGESYRLELTMCMLTVFSISLFTYVLSDLDQPFHGVFRIDLSILSQFLNDLESQWLSIADPTD